MSETFALPKLRFAKGAASCALLLSIVALCWLLSGIADRVRSPLLYPMGHASAVGVAALSVSLLAILSGRLHLSRGSAFAAVAVGFLSLTGHVVRLSHVDGVGQDPLPAFVNLLLTAFPNLLCLFVAGSAIAALASVRLSVHRSVWAAISGAVTATIGGCSLLNELLVVLPASPAFEGEVAIDATIALTLIGLALVQIAHAQAARAGEEVEVYRPVMVVVLGTMASFVMWRSLLEERTRVVSYQTANGASGIAKALRSELIRRLVELQHVADAPTAPALFEEIASATTSSVRWTDTRLLAASNDLEDASVKRLLAERGDRLVSSYAVLMEPDHEARVVFAAPLRRGDMRVMVTPLRDIVAPLAGNVLGQNFQLFLLRDDKEVYRYPNPVEPFEQVGRADVPLPELESVLRLHPRSSFVRKGASWASHMVLAIGLNASFLLAFSAYLLHVARSRLFEVQDIRSGLEKEVEQRRLAQAELARKARQLEASNADLREFAHVTSHDLQEPLRSISGFAQLVSRRYLGKLDADADEFLTYITASSSRMTGMIQSLLTYSRVVNAADLDEDVPLEEAVEWAKGNLMLALEESNAKLEVGQLPVINGNRTQLCQLMQNLIANAIKYRSSKPLVISVTAELNGSEHTITVADNGIGVASDYHERIFGLFKRAHGREYPGTGVGLAISKKVIERHGGRIWVESEVEVGSKFRFTIPTSQSNGF